jgi:hypothetical protein
VENRVNVGTNKKGNLLHQELYRLDLDNAIDLDTVSTIIDKKGGGKTKASEKFDR